MTQGVEVNHTGKRFGKLTALKRAYPPNMSKDARWECLCDCGNTYIATAYSLRTGKTTHCGCNRKKSEPKHGACPRVNGKSTPSREWRIWHGVKMRCFSTKDTTYKYYGGRGITMSLEWQNNFAQFLKDMGPCPPNFTLERVDNNGHYTAENCVWASRKEQGNNRRTCVLLTFGGETMSITMWAEKLGVKTNWLRYRLKKGLGLDSILGELKTKQ